MSHLQESKAPSHAKVTGMASAITQKFFHFLVPSPILYPEHDAIWYGTFFWTSGVRCPSCVPSQLVVHSQPPHSQSSRRNRKDLNECKHLLSSDKVISVFSRLFPAQIQNPVLAIVNKTNSSPRQNQHNDQWKIWDWKLTFCIEIPFAQTSEYSV